MESYILITKNYCLVLGVITENIGLKKSQNITYQEASKTFVFVCLFFLKIVFCFQIILKNILWYLYLIKASSLALVMDVYFKSLILPIQ